MKCKQTHNIKNIGVDIKIAMNPTIILIVHLGWLSSMSGILSLPFVENDVTPTPSPLPAKDMNPEVSGIPGG
jgi:hypothetical protein